MLPETLVTLISILDQSGVLSWAVGGDAKRADETTRGKEVANMARKLRCMESLRERPIFYLHHARLLDSFPNGDEEDSGAEPV
jgi:hypothetical protein